MCRSIINQKLIVTSMALLIMSSTAYGQKKSKASADSTSAPAAASGSPSATGQSGPAAPGAQGNTDRLDVSDLENKYWTPKDQEFTVVQNRTYTKKGRVSLLASYGVLLNDNYTESNNITVAGNYFFSERYGVELVYDKANPKANKVVKYFEDRYGTVPDHGQVKSYMGAAFNWVPFYAKMSLLESKILYFDLMISPGFGITQYEQMFYTGDKFGKSAPTFSLDITQQVFLSEHFAVRVDFRNRWFKEDVIKYSPGGTSLDQIKARTDNTHNSLLQIGLTYFF